MFEKLPVWAALSLAVPAAFGGPGGAAGALGWLAGLGFWWPAAVVTALWLVVLGIIFGLLYRDDMRYKEALEMERQKYGKYQPKP